MATLYRILFAYLPKRLLSRLLGKLATLVLPAWLLRVVIWIYAGWFRIDLSQFARPTGWHTFNDFFTRSFRAEVRPLALAPALCAPCDGRVIECGTVKKGQFLQIKKQNCCLGALWGTDIFPESPSPSVFEQGNFLSIYLGPRDYHRFHVPCQSEVQWVAHLPGDLWSVSPLGLRAIPSLFIRNERMALGMKSSFGEWVFVAVAATNVGNIKFSFPTPPTNQARTRPTFQYLKPAYSLAQGQELGRFLLGSSLMLVFPPKSVAFSASLRSGSALCLGQKMGVVKAGRATKN